MSDAAHVVNEPQIVPPLDRLFLRKVIHEEPPVSERCLLKSLSQQSRKNSRRSRKRSTPLGVGMELKDLRLAMRRWNPGTRYNWSVAVLNLERNLPVLLSLAEQWTPRPAEVSSALFEWCELCPSSQRKGTI